MRQYAKTRIGCHSKPSRSTFSKRRVIALFPEQLGPAHRPVQDVEHKTTRRASSSSWHPAIDTNRGSPSSEKRHPTLFLIPFFFPEHHARLNRERTWWENVPQLQRFVPEAVDPTAEPKRCT
jgi:hypothetical protein